MPTFIKNLPFSSRFQAKFAAGLAANRPAAPQGVGDAYYATDTAILSIANTAGSAWVQHDLSAIGVVPTPKCVRVGKTFGQTTTAGATTTLTWAEGADGYDNDNLFDPAQSDRLTIRTAGKYHISVIAGFDSYGDAAALTLMGNIGGTNEVLGDITIVASGGRRPIGCLAVDAQLSVNDYLYVQTYQNWSAGTYNYRMSGSYFSAYRWGA